MSSSAQEFMVGTASWTDKTLTETTDFYPPDVKTAEDRLRFYAAQFKTVEVDSTYYAIPAERNAELWRERTPPGFIFNIKAFAWLTQHRTDASRLPKEIKAILPDTQRAQRQLSPEKDTLDLAFKMFWSSLTPLHRADSSTGGSLGMLLFQFPPYFICKDSNRDYIASIPERMPGASIAIEFRHRSWTGEEKQRAQTLDFLRQHGLYFVSIDAPEDKSISPSIIDATGKLAYVRFHGRARTAWFGKHQNTRERFKYLYAERELAEKIPQLKSLQQRGGERASVIFNNCYKNFGILNAATMANMLKH